MPNAVEDALNRASAEQRERAMQTIEEARRNIQLVSVQQTGDISSTDANSLARNAQIIEEAKRTIPFETMKDVDHVSPPMNTPGNGPTNSNVIELHEHTQSTIENIEQGPGNNYMNDNAVDRAMARQSQDSIQQDQQRAMGR